MALEWLYEHWKSEFLANGFNEDVAEMAQYAGNFDSCGIKPLMPSKVAKARKLLKFMELKN